MINRLVNALITGWLLFLRDFQYRFELTYFGYIWAFIRPLLVVAPLILVGKQFNLGTGMEGTTRYEVFAFVGFILWQTFWDSVIMPQWFMRRVRKIVKRISFPYEIIIFASGFYILFYLFIYIIELIVVFFLFKVAIHTSLLLGLLSLLLLIIAGLALGIFIAPITFIYLDFRYSLPLLSSILLWITPVFYFVPKEGLLYIINKFNPMTYLINTPRSWFIGGLDSDVRPFIVCLSFFVGLFFLGLKFYYRTMPIAADEIL